MLALIDPEREPFVATEEEAMIAREALSKLKSLAAGQTDLKLRITDKTADVLLLPARAVTMLVDLLTAVAQRKPVSIIPHEAELTTRQAADFLNVSRPHLIAMLERGEIPYRLVGTHRRVRVSDLMNYRKKTEAERRAAIAAMVAEAQKLGLP